MIFTYHASNADYTDLWHKRLGYPNYTNLFKLTKIDVARGIPKHTERPKGVWFMPKRKQTRTSHRQC